MSGARISGHRITVTKTELTATIQVQHHVKLPVLLILQYRAILKWHLKADIQMPLP